MDRVTVNSLIHGPDSLVVSTCMLTREKNLVLVTVNRSNRNSKEEGPIFY